MSRSIKYNPIHTDGKNGRVIQKRFANKVVRRHKQQIAKGASYKKLYNSWNIHDFKIRYPWEEAKFDYIQNKNDKYYHTLKDFYRFFWCKYYRRK